MTALRMAAPSLAIRRAGAPQAPVRWRVGARAIDPQDVLAVNISNSRSRRRSGLVRGGVNSGNMGATGSRRPFPTVTMTFGLMSEVALPK